MKPPMMNSVTPIPRPFLSQFEVEISPLAQIINNGTNESAKYRGDGWSETKFTPVDATKITHVKHETTDDE
jgi:hypothetical protein